MKFVFHSFRHHMLVALASCIALCNITAGAQENAQSARPDDAFREPEAIRETPAPDTVSRPPVQINSKTNTGDLSYTSFFGIQTLLQSFLPPEPRVTDFTYRLSFKEIGGAARDEFVPESWGVAVVGDTVDQVIPVSRGGYFVLPDIAQAANENATIMFNAQTRWRTIEVEFKVRTSPHQTLAYTEFARAIEEFRGLQRKIPWYRLGLRAIRNAGVDGLKACFHSTDGRIDIDGVAANSRVDGMCHLLAFEPSKAASATSTISFVGPLDHVILDAQEN